MPLLEAPHHSRGEIEGMGASNHWLPTVPTVQRSWRKANIYCKEL